MSARLLAPVNALAGHPVPDSDLEQVVSILRGIMADIQALRDLDLPDDLEPILSFHIEPWG